MRITQPTAYASSPATPNQQARDRALTMAPQVAMAAADVYAAATCGFSPFTASHTAPVVAGLTAVVHTVYAISQLSPWFNDEYYTSKDCTPQRLACGFGHIITAAGFATLVAGLGPWSLPIIAIGETVRLASAFIR